MAQTRDLAVVVGKYTGSDGKEHNRYKKIGELVIKDDGGEFLSIDATCLTMELNYLANHQRRHRINVSIFDNDEDEPAETPPSDGIPF